MRHLLYIFLYLSFQLNGQDSITTKAIYYDLDSCYLKAKFKSKPITSGIRQDKDIITQRFASEDNQVYYGLELIKSVKFPNLADSIKKLDDIAGTLKNQAKGSLKGKLTQFKKSTFKNRPAYLLDFQFQEQYTDYFMTSIVFLHKNNIIKAFVVNPIGKTSKKDITTFFDSIILRQ